METKPLVSWLHKLRGKQAGQRAEMLMLRGGCGGGGGNHMHLTGRSCLTGKRAQALCSWGKDVLMAPAKP